MPLYAAIDVGFPDDPKVIDAGDIAELVYLRCVLRCRQHLTDGVIDRRVLPRWLAGIRGKATTHMDRLVEVGLLCTHPDGWCIPLNAWKKWNPTKLEVEEKRDAEKQRKAEWRARQLSQRDTAGTDVGHQRQSGDVPDVSAPVKPEPALKPEPTSTTGDDEDDDPVLAEAERRTTLAIRAGVEVRSRGSYTLGVYRNLLAEGWKPEQEAIECTTGCDGGWISEGAGERACPDCLPWLVEVSTNGN